MIVFTVVKERHGWAVRMGEQMSTPFWSRVQAIREAHRMAAGLQRHGAATQVLIEDAETLEAVVVVKVAPASGAQATAGRGSGAGS